MYAHHHTRIYPKRDDVYRAEYPGPYYSTSSVYSYSPTSASDCPEHGRSRKKITVILTTSIILATLGVLSIAGVAAYLGILSKNISNNASQSAIEESYLLTGSDGRINPVGGYFTTTEENEYIFTTNDDVRGLDALEGVPGDSLVDLTNSLSETSSRSSTPAPNNYYHRRTTSTSAPTRTIEGHYGNVNNGDTLINSNDNILSSNVVTAPPPHEEDNGVRFFTEEANTASKSVTKVPPRHNKNRQRFPFTNSHSLEPSTTTMMSSIEGGSDDDGENEKHVPTNNDDLEKQKSGVVHLSHPANAKTAEAISETLLKSSNKTSFEGGFVNNTRSKPVPSSTHRSDSATISSNKNNGGTISSSTILNVRNGDGDDIEKSESASHHIVKQNKTREESLKPVRKPSDNNRGEGIYSTKNADNNMALGSGMTSFNRNHDEDDMMQADDPIDANNNNLRRHDQVHRINMNKNGESDNHDEESRQGNNRPQHMLKPIHPIVSSEQDSGGSNSENLLKNHKLPLSFDRISPEYYDNQPWTPLLNRPNLDKRPRVDIENSHLSSTEPVIVWNSEEPEEEQPHEMQMPQQPPYHPQNVGNYSLPPSVDIMYGLGGNFTVGTYYGYGHSGPSSETDVTLKPKGGRPGAIMDEPISYQRHPVLSANGIKLHNESYPNAPQQPGNGGEFINGFKPSNLPAYTILIPHIPNPSTTSKQNLNVSQTTPHSRNDEILSPLLSPPQNYGNAYKMDRLGEVQEEDVTTGPHDDSVVKKYRNPTSDYGHPSRKDKNKHEPDKITYNFQAIKTIPVPEDEALKDDDYVDTEMDEFTESSQGETKIYRLDPESVVDLVPDTLGNANKPTMPTTSTTTGSPPSSTAEEQDLSEENGSESMEESVENIQNKFGNGVTVNTTKNFEKEFSPESMELVVGPKEPDVLIKSTTDLIMSTLGSLNLIKSPAKEVSEEEINDKLRNSDVVSEEEIDEGEDIIPANSTGQPLFPPVRSYVAVNLPLRPKPNKTEPSSSNKQFRNTDMRLESILPSFPPDVATTASLHKVISMMLGADENNFKEKSRQLANHPLIQGLFNKQNETIVVANETGALSIANLNAALPTVMPTQRQTPTTEQPSSTTPIASDTTSHREQKSFNSGHRDSKIDHAQFQTAADNVEHVPVPLIMTESPMKSGLPAAPLHLTAFPWSSKPPKASAKVHQSNSPVYKFVLKKGQSVEDLLKEIFLNYTEPPREGTIQSESGEMQQIPVKLGMIANNPALKSLENINIDQTTAAGIVSSEKINHHAETTPMVFNPPQPTTSSSIEEDSSREIQTSTSVVVNEEVDIDYGCGGNDTFKCKSSGKCLPAYLRCNFIKECEDNSDEEGCLCADFLRANGNARKLCDGIPDCADASDEYQDCEYCQPGQYICAGTRTCINKDQICDSKRDCQYGDDESDCVKIGQNDIDTLKEDFSPTYHKQGHLMVRKTGNWGKLCVESFSSVVSHWEVKDLARAVCKALTFSDYDKVEKVIDQTPNGTEPYYELYYNQTATSEESHQRPGLGFRQTECNSKLIVNVTCQSLQCGVAPRAYTQRARIVGGANSLPGKWPWQAALYKNGEYQCGATLISSRWLLSAGHCFYHAQDDHWVARLGTLRRGATVLSPYEQVVRITHIFLHPEYKDVGFINDVSLLRLEKEVNFTDFVRPVCLPGKESRIRDGRMCTVVGWGQLFEVGRVFPDTLQEVQLPLISTRECRKRTLFLPLYKLTDQMFCAGFDRGGRDACLGDSGGPLMCPESDGRWSLYGVTSNGYGCARANRPGVYTKVTSYLDWIYEKMSQDSAFAYRDKSKPCPGHRCLLGECLDKRQVCNGIRDCIEDDGSDERGPNCTTYAHL